MKKFLSFVVVLGLVAAPVFSQDELPVEVDIELLSEALAEKLDVDEAKAKLADYGKELGLKKRDTKKAAKVMEQLVAQDVSVEKALKVVTVALDKGENVKALARKDSVERIKREETARGEVEKNADEKGLKAEDVAEAVEVLEGLIEKGIPVEHALSVVREAISKDRDPAELKAMLTDQGAEEMKKAMERGEVDVDAILEKISIDEIKETVETEMPASDQQDDIDTIELPEEDGGITVPDDGGITVPDDGDQYRQ